MIPSLPLPPPDKHFVPVASDTSVAGVCGDATTMAASTVYWLASTFPCLPKTRYALNTTCERPISALINHAHMASTHHPVAASSCTSSGEADSPLTPSLPSGTQDACLALPTPPHGLDSTNAILKFSINVSCYVRLSASSWQRSSTSDDRCRRGIAEGTVKTPVAAHKNLLQALYVCVLGLELVLGSACRVPGA